MKKSFKKAGAAVLSMAMLLAMGSISMPVYAENTAKATPGQVWVQISGVADGTTYKQGEGKDDTSRNNTGTPGVDNNAANANGWRYDYLTLQNVTKATVKMYRVANLDGQNGWQWATGLNPTAADGFNGWDQLYATDNNEQFTTKSSDLQKLASYCAKNTSGLTLVGTSEINYANGDTGTYLPLDAQLLANANSTGNNMSYYVIITETDQAGVLVQPILISLKNGAENPKSISLKGTTIDVDKKIISVKDVDTNYTENNSTLAHNGQGVNKDATKSVVADNGKSAVVAEKDKVHYEIYARLPKYDANVEAGSIEDFVITDIADDGIVVDVNSVTAYLSVDDEANLSAADRTTSARNNWTLAKGSLSLEDSDYDVASTANGFTLTIDGERLKGEKGTYADTDVNKTGQANMQNLYILVSFDATLDEANFDRSYRAPKKFTDVTGVERDAVTVEEVREILSGQNTRYLSTAVTYSNANLISALGDSTITTIGKAAQTVTGTNTVANAKTALANSAAAMTASDLDAMVANIADDDDDLIALADTTDGLAYELNDAGQLLEAKKALAVLQNYYIRTQIALDLKNSTLNGEHNKATMKYGNQYATGGGATTMSTDITTLYSVDIQLDKWAEKIRLASATPAFTEVEPSDILDALKVHYDDDTLNAAAAKAAITADETAYDVSNIADDDADLATVASQLGYALSNDTEKAAAKKALAILNRYNKYAQYDATYEKEAVKDAVFKLTKVYDGTEGAEQVKVIGYAVSDANGRLKILTEHTTGTATADAKYTDTDTGYWYTLDAGADDAWNMLTIGDYELEEVYSPTGFKKWGAPSKFTITAPANAGGTAYQGNYTASVNGTGFESISGTSEPFTYVYDNTTDPNDPHYTGILKNNVYNQYYDTLPATGGIGTVLFTAGGISVVLIAGALFVMYMKKRNAEDEE